MERIARVILVEVEFRTMPDSRKPEERERWRRREAEGREEQAMWRRAVEWRRVVPGGKGRRLRNLFKGTGEWEERSQEPEPLPLVADSAVVFVADSAVVLEEEEEILLEEEEEMLLEEEEEEMLLSSPLLLLLLLV